MVGKVKIIDFFKSNWLLISIIISLFIWIINWQKENVIELDSKNLAEEVYLWQRVWTKEVKEALPLAEAEFDTIAILGVELNWREKTGWDVNFFKDSLDYSANNFKAIIDVRIGSEVAKSQWSKSALAVIDDVIARLPEANRIQLDYDCPTSELRGYLYLIKHLQNKFPSRKFEITALPTWLTNKHFKLLVKRLDRYIMQVHGVSGYGLNKLCDIDYTLEVADKCHQLGVPYLLALPTYAHAINYDKQGVIKQVISEGGNMQQGLDYNYLRADAQEITALVSGLRLSHPKLLQGLVWYRMPVSTDKMNWTWKTLTKVRSAEYNQAKLSVVKNQDSSGLYEIAIVNNSSQRLDYPKSLTISWMDDFCIGGDGYKAYQWQIINRQNQAEFIQLRTDIHLINPGESISIGWLRLTQPKTQIKIKFPSNINDEKKI